MEILNLKLSAKQQQQVTLILQQIPVTPDGWTKFSDVTKALGMSNQTAILRLRRLADEIDHIRTSRRVHNKLTCEMLGLKRNQAAKLYNAEKLTAALLWCDAQYKKNVQTILNG